MNTVAIATGQVLPSEGSINLLDSCLKMSAKLTETDYYNICDGSINTVPYGFFDSLIGAILVGMAILIFTLFYKLLND